MEKLNQSANLDKFFSDFGSIDHRILFLDYDGTLAPIVEDRSKAFPYPGITDRLNLLVSSQQTRLIIVSGRTLDDLKKLLKLEVYPEMWGGHGTERFSTKTRKITVEIDDKAKAGLDEAIRWVNQSGLGKYSEVKVTGLSLHWRGRTDKERDEIENKVLEKWGESAGEYNLELHKFDGGIELRYCKMHKGKVVDTVLKEVNISSIVSYLGDDLTDEEAFAVLGNKGLKVLVRAEPRQTKADIRITPPTELLEFIDRWIAVDSSIKR